MLENVRIYTAMENLFTITGYSGYTPDLGVNTGDGATGSGYRQCHESWLRRRSSLSFCPYNQFRFTSNILIDFKEIEI